MDGLLELLIWLVRAAYKAYRKRQGEIDEADEDLLPPSERTEPGDPQAARHRVEDDVEALRSEVTSFVRRENGDPAIRALQTHASHVLLGAADAGVESLRTAADLRTSAARVAAETSRSRRVLKTLRRMAEQRDDPTRVTLLQDVETVATALYQPLLDVQERRDIPLSTRRVIAVEGEAPGDLTRLFAAAPVAPIEVSVRLRHDILGWPAIALEVGRDVLVSLEGLGDEVRAAAGFPAARPQLDPGYLSEAHVQGALGGWLPELCAEGVASLLLGPAYLASLISLQRQPDQPYRTRTVPIADGRVLPSPPAELRVQIAAAILEQIGFADEANALVDDWTAVHGDPMEFLFPVGGGRYAAIPEDMLLQPVRDLAQALCGHQIPSLAGMHFVDIPDLHYSLARHREAEAIATSNTHRQDEDPRTATAGYALLGYREPDRRMQLSSSLRGVIGRQTQIRPLPARVEPAAEESLVSPAVLRDAIVLQGFLQRVRG